MTRETAINLLDNLIGMVEDNQQSDYDEAFKLAIRSLKSWDEDVAPVVHGSWVFEKDLIIHGSCSVCGWAAHYCEDDVFGENYCPNCGARMDGEK